MHPTTAVEVEVVVPCTEGQEHPIRLRIVSWEQWEVAYTPCESLLGRAFGLMAPCSHYVRENRDRLKQAVVQQLARVGAPAVPALITALEDENEFVRQAACEALGKIGDAQAVPALRVHAEYLTEARQALQQLGKADYPLEQAVQELAQQELWGVLMRALPAEQVRTAVAQLGAPAAPALIKALGDRDWNVRRAACEALGQIGDASAVPVLIQALGDRNEYVRRAACKALGQIGDASAAPALIKALGDRNELVRRAACWALGQIGDASAVPALIKALGDGNELVRRAACEALGQIGDARAVPVLIQALGDSDGYVRAAACEALVKIGAPAVPALIQALGDERYDVRRAAAEALVKIGAPAVPALRVHAEHLGAARQALQQLGKADYPLEQAVQDLAQQELWAVLIRALPAEKVRNAVVQLGTLAAPALIKALGDRNELVRRAACWALGQIGDASAVPALIKALGDSDWYVRKAACEALGQIGDTQAVPVLIQALGDTNRDVRRAACGALGQIGDASAVPALIKALGDRNELVRRAACEALGQIGDTQAMPALIQALGDSDRDVREAACKALGQIGDTQAVPALFQALEDWDKDVRSAAAEALVKIGAPAVPALIQALGDRDGYVRKAACEALGQIGDTQAMPALIKALGDSDWYVRKAACEALGQIGDTQAVPVLRVHAEHLDAARQALQQLGKADYPLEQAVQQLVQQDLWTVLIRALPAEKVRDAVVQLGTLAVPALIQALGDSDMDVRKAACEALGQIGDTQAVPVLRVHAEHLDAARQALQQLGKADYPLEQAVQQLAQQELWAVLIRALPAEKVRDAVVQLGTLAVPALIQALGDTNRDVRRAACGALGQIGDMQAVPALIQALVDRNELVRRAAREALVKIGAPALRQVLADERESVREAAANALRRIEGSRRLSEHDFDYDDDPFR